MKVISQYNVLSIFLYICLTLLLTACDSSPKDISNEQNSNDVTNKQQLLAQLDEMQLKWLQQGVEEYEFELQRECDDCPEIVQTPLNISARSLDDQDTDQNNNYQINNLNHYFADLRQAILSNQVKNISYNTQYGYPQQVRLVSPDQFLAMLLRIRNFRVIQQAPLANVSLQGKLTRVLNTGTSTAADYFLVNNNGFYRLQIPSTLNAIVNTITPDINVIVTGNWIASNTFGQRQLLVATISQLQQVVNRTTLQGTLTWAAGSNNFSLFDGYSIYNNLQVPANLQTVAVNFALAGQKVQITGIMQSNPNGTKLIVVENISLIQEYIEQFTGVLNGMGNPCIGCPTYYNLQQDNGATYQLNLIPAAQAQARALVNRRVKITGVRVNQNGSFQPAIDVRQIVQFPNIVTEVSLYGTIVNQLPANFNDNIHRFILQTDNSASVIISIPPSLQMGLPLGIGMRVSVLGSWAINPFTGQTELRLNTVPQILDNPGQFSRYEGTIVAMDCNNANYDTYYYVADTGESLRLRIDNSLNTFVVAKIRYAVTGMQQGNEFVATKVEPIPSVAVMPPPISGTIISAGPTDTLGCTQVHNFTLLNDNGLQQTIRASSSLGIGVIQSLAPGSRIVINRYHLSLPNSVIDVLDIAKSDNGLTTQLEGAIVTQDCIQGLYNSYYFASTTGNTYTLEIRNLQQAANFPLDNGVSVVVDGVLNNTTLDVSRIELHPIRTLIPPFARGTIISTAPTKTLSCGGQLYGFNFQNENGLNQIIYVTPQLFNVNMPLFNIGNRVEFNLPAVLGTNDPVLYPVSIRLFN